MASVVQIDPVASALTAIRDHFIATLPGTPRVVRGPQELGVSQTGSEIEFSIIPLAREWEELTPTEVDKSGAPTALVTWKVAQLRIQAQLDLWGPYRVGTDLLGLLVEKTFHNRLPWVGGLHLLSNWYFDRPLIISKAGGGIIQREPEKVAQGSWRRTWTLEILTDLVVQGNLPVTSEILLQLSTQLGPDTVAEPDNAIT